MSKAEKNRISKLLPFSVVITPFLFIFGHIFAWIFYSDFGIDYLALASFNSGGYFVISHPFLILFPLIIFLNTLFYFSYFYYKYHKVNDLGDSIGSLSMEVGGMDKEFSRISLMVSDLRDKTRKNRYLIRKKIQEIRYFRNEKKESNFIKLNKLDSSMASLRFEYKKTLRNYIFSSKEIAYQKEKTFFHRSKIERYDDIVLSYKNGRLSKVKLIFHVFILLSFFIICLFIFQKICQKKKKKKYEKRIFNHMLLLLE